jgi:hypothetical protein
MRLIRLIPVLAVVGLWLVAGRAAAADFPKGTFTIKASDAMWAVTFDGKGKFKVTRDGQEGLTGSYKVTKDEIELTDEEGPFAGKGDQKACTYKWKLDGKKLTFTKVKDESEGRSAIITAGAWDKKDD